MVVDLFGVRGSARLVTEGVHGAYVGYDLGILLVRDNV